MLAGVLHRVSGLRVHATDGDVGQVYDLCIEDRHWRVEYLHVDTRQWLLGRHVLITPATVQAVDWERGRIYVGLTRGQVAASPDIDSHKPDDRRLWSARALAHYGLEREDGNLGRVDDLLIDTDGWAIRHITADTVGAVVPVDFIESIDGDAKRIRVGLNRATIERLPRLDAVDRFAGTSR